MLFQTVEFLVLMLVVLGGIAAFRSARPQHYLLFVASFLFYAWWDARFVVLLLLTSMVDYVAALGMVGTRIGWRERARLSGGMVAATFFFLGLNWPAVQHGEWPTLRAFFSPGWEAAPLAIAACVAFAVLWPVAYELYFRLSEAGRRRAFVLTSVVMNLAVLGFFKYFNFFRDNAVLAADTLGVAWAPPALSVALPVGISFYTFVTMSYVIDVYRGSVVPERSFLRMGLFVSYFPHLVAGPIIRPEQLLPRLEKPWRLETGALLSGFHLALVGLLKKVLIADSVAPLVETILGSPQGKPSLAIMLGAALFAVQIYCDFSGYTDIARGVSRMLGVELPLNFDFPYISRSITEFWRRWHISLSTWLRDYLYIPLGGNRLGVGRTYFNLMATMALGGLWHGASWNFLLWGVYQGALLCVNRWFDGIVSRSERLKGWFALGPVKVLSWAATMYFVLLGWLIFRVTSAADLVYVVKSFVVFDGRLQLSSLGLGTGAPITALLACTIFVAAHAASIFRERWASWMDRLPPRTQPILYAAAGLILFFGWPRADAPFIYFQF